MNSTVIGTQIRGKWTYITDGRELDFPSAVVAQVPDFRRQLHVEETKHSCFSHCVGPVLSTHLHGGGGGGESG